MKNEEPPPGSVLEVLGPVPFETRSPQPFWAGGEIPGLEALLIWGVGWETRGTLITEAPPPTLVPHGSAPIPTHTLLIA